MKRALTNRQRAELRQVLAYFLSATQGPSARGFESCDLKTRVEIARVEQAIVRIFHPTKYTPSTTSLMRRADITGARICALLDAGADDKRIDAARAKYAELVKQIRSRDPGTPGNYVWVWLRGGQS